MLLEVKNLTLGYDRNIIIKNLNFEIKEKDFICLVGHNGSGKTTLLKALLGLIPVKSGQIIFGQLRPGEIGFLPQETSIDPHFPASVLEIVCLGALGKKHFITKADQASALEKLKILKIEDLKDRSFASLSGGQKQKVFLARGLLASSKLLILDEPENNLDQSSKENLMKTLKDLNQNHGLAILMVTHDLDHDNLIGNKILALKSDETFFGSTASYVKKVHHE